MVVRFRAPGVHQISWLPFAPLSYSNPPNLQIAGTWTEQEARGFDENVASFERGEASVTAIMESAAEPLVPVVVQGELHAGFQLGDRAERNTGELEDSLSEPGVAAVDADRRVAEHYRLPFEALEAMGRPAAPNDPRIAAIAVETGSRVPSDAFHFYRSRGVRATTATPRW